MKAYSLKQLNGPFIKAAILTVILALLGGGAMFGYAKHKQKTTYTATRYVLISHNVTQQNPDRNNPVSTDDLNMMPSYADIAENELIAKEARPYLPKKVRKANSANQINEAVSAKTSPQSLVLKLSAKTGQAKDSVLIVNAVAKSLQKELPELQPGAGQVHLLAAAQKANVTSETTPNKKKYTLVGVALGGLLGLIISFIAITWTKLMGKD